MYTYQLNCGQYVLCRDGRPILRPLDDVALAASADSASGEVTLHKHGDPTQVEAWFQVAHARLCAAGASGNDRAKAMAEELKVVRGHFDVNVLNLAINGARSALRELVFPTHVIDVDCQEVLANGPDDDQVTNQSERRTA